MARQARGFWLFLLGLLGFYSGNASAATAAVLCNADIKGDSQVSGATDCIDVLAWSWGLSSQVSGGAKGNQLGVPTVKEFTFTKQADSSSEDLLSFASLHKSPMTGIVEFREYQNCGTGCDSTTPYLTIHMKQAQVSSMSMGNSSGGDFAMENISLVFNQISYCYQAQGKGAPQCFAYDVANNVSISPF